MTVTYVFDTSPLSVFARSQWLGVLKAVVQGSRAVIPDLVAAEVAGATAEHPHLRAVQEADWLEVITIDTTGQLAALVHYEQRLVGPSGRNLGECGVLALAESITGAVAVVDDRVARRAGLDRHVEVRGSLGLMCEAIRKGLLTVPLVSAVADDLLEHEYRLPFGPGGFAAWAEREGLF